MRKLYLVFTVLLVNTFFLFQNTYSQISHGGTPPSFKSENLASGFEIITLQQPDINKLAKEDAERGEKDELYRYGIGIDVDINTENSGTWTTLNNMQRVWRLTIQVKDALALGLYYSNFVLPEGSKLFIYNASKSQVIGSFTEQNNPVAGIFATELIQGESLTLEYVESETVKESPIIQIEQVVYAYRAVNFLFERKLYSPEYNSSDACEVDVNCAESANWQNQKKGVCRISVKSDGSYGWCSGSLINNTENDCLPYVLTANHCADNFTQDDLFAWVFYFNYERVGCNVSTESEPVPQTISGCIYKANGSTTSGSDFFLILMSNFVPSSFDAYFNGWRSTNLASPSGVGIHHPAGDIKKISTYTTALSNDGTAYWSVIWATTTNGHGVTEGGSSGSPIFNNEGLVVGQLFGGLSACVTNGAGTGTGPTKRDSYGKVSYSWSSCGSVANKRLKDWLNPDATNPATLAGKNADCTNMAPIADFLPSATTVAIGTNVKFTNMSVVSAEDGITTGYQWQFQGVSGSLTSVVNSPNRTFNTVGTFPVVLTATASDGLSSSVTKYINVTSNGIDEIESDISIYPNPAKDFVEIGIGNESYKIDNIVIVNSFGEVVKYIDNHDIQNNLIEVNTSGLAQGMYYISITTNNQIMNYKLAIVR